ncbi:hypothetical protein LTR95_012728 [Oleoguttula sp. CCFEE 5521]
METALHSSHLHNRQTSSYFASLEARVRDLEEKLASYNVSEESPTVETVKDSDVKAGKSSKEESRPLGGTLQVRPLEISVVTPLKANKVQPEANKAQPEGWDIKPSVMLLKEFMKPAKDPHQSRSIVDVLMEEVPILWLRRRPRHRSQQDQARPVPSSSDVQEVHRFRINSPLICNAFAAVMGSGKSYAPKAGETHIAPFKAVLTFYDDLCDYSRDLDARFSGVQAHELPSKTALVQGTAEVEDEVDEAPEEDDEEVTTETAQHLQGFLSFVAKHLASELSLYKKIRARECTKDPPTVWFRDLWKMYAPGDIVYNPKTGQAGRVHSAWGGRRLLRYRDDYESDFDAILGDSTLSRFAIALFSLDFDGRIVGPVKDFKWIDPYEGPKPVSTLPVYPIEYGLLENLSTDFAQAGPTSSLRKMLCMRGQNFAAFARSVGVAYKDYNGVSADETPVHIESEVVVDLEQYYQSRPPEERVSFDFPDVNDIHFAREISEMYPGNCDCAMEDCPAEVELSSNLYDDRSIDLYRVEAALVDVRDVVQYKTAASQDALRHKYPLLLPSITHGFVLKTREWHALHTDKIVDIQEDKQKFEDLVLLDEHKDMIMSLVSMHPGCPSTSEDLRGPQEKPQRRSELVRGKRSGLIILLHGVPGVGKTSTVECVAEYTGRPLYTLTCSDVGETPTEVQDNLLNAFALAYKWGCILLLDDADVFLAERSRVNMRHNAVVATFLRMLDYYSGILFLTTNRIGVIDDAFKSRIHLALYYDRLNKDQTMQVWKINLRHLSINQPNIKLDMASIMRWASNFWEENQQNPWNGRQIQNAVRTMAALAAFDPDGDTRLKRSHFRRIAHASKAFDQYLEETRGQDDLAMAHTNQERLDPRKFDLRRLASKSPSRIGTSVQGTKRSNRDKSSESDLYTDDDD